MAKKLAWSRRLTVLALVGIAVKIVLLFYFAYHIQFVMDEFQQFGQSKLIGNGFFETIWPAKGIGYAVFYRPALWIGWDASSMLLIGRMQTALLACGTLALVYACARALGEHRGRALLIVLVLLCFSSFIERIFRTRAEPLAVFFAVAALLVVLRGKADRAMTIIGAGILSGLAFVTTQKSVYFNVALGLALVIDALLAGRIARGVRRGAWLVLGWLVPITVYCFAFGGGEPMRVAENLIFGPVEVATQAAAVYGGLRHYVLQTLSQNALLYAFCIAGMAIALLRIRSLDPRRRVALVFSVVITALVFAHDQPWPYVFVMALPFMVLWPPQVFDALSANKLYFRIASAVLGIAVVASFVKNAIYLEHDNREQLQLVARAESLLGPGDVYFDGVGMLPNRPEPSTLWLDRLSILRTLREDKDSQAYRIFVESPPKIILWSYRTDAVEPLIGPLIRNSYVKIGPNLLVVGTQLQKGRAAVFDVPIAGGYGLYDRDGGPISGRVAIDGIPRAAPFDLPRGRKALLLADGPATAFILPEGLRPGMITPDAPDYDLFAGVYD